MIELLLIRQALILIFLTIASYTDIKERLIFDTVTYPAIAIGILLNLWQQDFFGIGIGLIVFGVGYIVYYTGKIGGGDVKMYAALAFLLPYFGGEPFVASVLVLATLSSVVILSAWYVGKYFKTGIDFEYNKQNMMKAAGLGIVLTAYFAIMLNLETLLPLTAIVIGIPVLFGLVFVAFEKGIRKTFFLKTMKLAQLDEDEVVATEFLDDKTNQLLGLKIKGVLGEQEIQKLKTAGIESVPVYRDLPPFAPFTLIGTGLAFLYPGILQVMLGI
jgi:Flp pilus assembly protein protease CpaA